MGRWRGLLEEQTGPLSWLSQVHGTRIVDAGGPVQEADGMIVRPGEGGAVMVADCAPLLMVGESIGAVVHVGRAGLLGGIAARAVERLRAEGASSISAVIGPAVCGECYEVGQALSGEAEERLPGSSRTTRWGTPGIDIPGALAAQLTGLGADVESVGVCTMEDERFFSHRRQAGKAGRFAGILVLNRDTPHGLAPENL